jgi:hypothetical protein
LPTCTGFQYSNELCRGNKNSADAPGFRFHPVFNENKHIKFLKMPLDMLAELRRLPCEGCHFKKIGIATWVRAWLAEYQTALLWC